jgi:hypothetical protein
MPATAVTHVKRYLRAHPGAFPSPVSAPEFERHRRKCAICHHPEREAIEELFVYWHSSHSIKGLFELPDRCTIYRHARAAGLYELRRHNIRAVLELLLEKTGGVEPTAMAIIAAVRAYACLTDSGAWLEPEKRIHMTTVIRREHPDAVTSTDPDSQVSTLEEQPPCVSSSLPLARRGGEAALEKSARSTVPSASRVSDHWPRATAHEPSVTDPSPLVARHSPLISNRQSAELETPVSHTKQTAGAQSNRQIRQQARRDLPLAQKIPTETLK